MDTSLSLLTRNANNPTAKALEDEAKPAVEFVKSNKGKKPTGPYQKKQPQRGMGVAQLELLRLQEERMKIIQTSTTQFPPDPNGATNIPVLHGVANYGVPMMINCGTGGLFGWGDAAGLVMQRVVGNGGFVGLNGPVAPGTVQAVEASKELSSMPKLQHYKPNRRDVCFKKKRCNGDNERLNRGFDKFGQVLPNKGADCLGWNPDNNQSINEDGNGFSARAARSAAAYAGHKNINETVEVLAIHRKGSSMGTGSAIREYDFFPGKSSRSTCSKEWDLPAQASVAVAGGANVSNSVDLSLKL